MSKRPRHLVTTVVLLVLVAAFSWWAGGRITSTGQVAAATRPPPPAVLTALVERRVLSDVVIVRGTILPADQTDVAIGSINIPHGDPIVTRTLLSVGASVVDGTVLIEIAGRPLFAVQGAVPMYRDLYPGDHGTDVAQLRDGLTRLGFRSIDGPGLYGPSTAAAVSALYRRAGYDPAVVTVGQVDPSPPGSTAAPAPPATSVIVPRSELTFAPSLPAHILAMAASVGQRIDKSVLTLSSGPLLARADLSAAQAGLIHMGNPATVDVGDGIDTPVSATVTSLTVVAASTGESQSAGPTAKMSLAPAAAFAPSQVNQAAIIRIQTSTTGQPVMVVPLTAISSTVNATQSIVRVDGIVRATVPVRLGLSVAGFVEVTPLSGHLEPGDRVVIGAK